MTTKRSHPGRRLAGAAAFLLVGAGVPAGAQMTPQAGSPRMVAMGYVEEILAAPPADLAAVLDRTLAPTLLEALGSDGLTRQMTALRATLAGASLRGGRPLGPTRVTLVFESPEGEARVTVGMEADPPHRLTEIALEAPGGATEDLAMPAGHPTLTALATELLTLLEREDFRGAAERQTIPGLRERYGTAELTRIFSEIRDGLGEPGGPLSLARVVEEGERVWIHVETPEGGELRFGVFPTTEAPYLVRGLDARVTPVFTGPPPTPDDWPALIRAFVGERALRGEFSGAVAVGRHGVPLFAEAWGVADAETGRPVTPETPINIGSMNKMFTGLALAQLEAAGRVNFDEPVGTYLPHYPNETIRTRSSLHQLLTHTSGIPSYWNPAYEAARDSLDTLSGIASTFAREPLLFEPGTAWEYSNGGPVVAGRILEEVTGTSYYDYMRTHVYRPAGMTGTDHYRKTDDSVGFAVGYGSIVDGEPRSPNTGALGLIGSPAGGGYSTVLDLVRFSGALAEGALLPRADLERVWSPPATGPEESRYGYLWGNGVEAGQRWVGHNGGGPGVSADFRYFPESGYVIVVLSNLSGGAMPVSQWITDLVARGIAEAASDVGPGAGASAASSPHPASSDSAAVRDAALDYLEGWFTGDPDRMTRSLHPDLVKRRVVSDALSEQSRDDLTGMAARMAGRAAPAGLAEGIRILDLTDQSAVVRIDAPGWIDWLLLARIDGRWSIVQVLWETPNG